ncbi:MAG: hypothetical protein M1819_003590 [Sarea resinae]|nr:MAG: hypothetical protein M1819_003590 [Sarea resinae]
MHDLRRKALESGKTVSKKAQSKQASRNSSRPNSTPSSRTHSRNASRHGSDEEDGNLSDGTSWSVNSIDEVLNAEDVDVPAEAWKNELGDRMEQLIDRKRSSVQGREESLAAYVRILTAHYAEEEIESRVRELVPAFLKSIKSESSEKETILALKALAMTLITSPSDEIYDAVDQPLNRLISNTESLPTKTAAIHTLGTMTFYGGASVSETEETMSTLLAIIESDGHSVNAPDAPDVVTAALEEWGFLATQLDDLESPSQEAMDAFVDQLDSSDPGVQTAAGENIALVYEASYTPLEDDESAPSSGGDDEEDEEDPAGPDGPKLINRYSPYPHTHQLIHTLTSLSTLSSRSLSKKNRKSLHASFADILNSVQHPTRGPRYQNALNQETGKRYGSRMTVKIHSTGEMRIDKWWKLLRLQALRRTLQGGFVMHLETNAVVGESLPCVVFEK